MMNENDALMAQAAEVVTAATALTERYIMLLPATQQRLRLLTAAEQAAHQRTVDALMTALEAMGIEGQVLGYDPQTGMVKMAG